MVINRVILQLNTIKAIRLDPNREYEIWLDRIISMSFTWFNVTQELNNQKIRY